MDQRTFAIVAAVIAAWGLVRGIMSLTGIRRLKDEVHWTDVWFYGVIPSLIYLALGIVALSFWSEVPWAEQGVAAVIVAILLSAIRNEWDLITWIAPRHEGKDSQ
jgi:hypothetical protein